MKIFNAPTPLQTPQKHRDSLDPSGQLAGEEQKNNSPDNNSQTTEASKITQALGKIFSLLTKPKPKTLPTDTLLPLREQAPSNTLPTDTLLPIRKP